MPMMIVQFKLEDHRTRERNPAKIPRVGAGGRHTNIVLDSTYELEKSERANVTSDAENGKTFNADIESNLHYPLKSPKTSI